MIAKRDSLKCLHNFYQIFIIYTQLLCLRFCEILISDFIIIIKRAVRNVTINPGKVLIYPFWTLDGSIPFICWGFLWYKVNIDWMTDIFITTRMISSLVQETKPVNKTTGFLHSQPDCWSCFVGALPHLSSEPLHHAYIFSANIWLKKTTQWNRSGDLFFFHWQDWRRYYKVLVRIS